MLATRAAATSGGLGQFSVGAWAALLIQRFSIWPSCPDERSWSIALETHPVSGEPLASRAPHWSPPGAENWPTIVALGTCTAVRYSAVGRSTTTASTWPSLSAVT